MLTRSIILRNFIKIKRAICPLSRGVMLLFFALLAFGALGARLPIIKKELLVKGIGSEYYPIKYDREQLLSWSEIQANGVEFAVSVGIPIDGQPLYLKERKSLDQLDTLINSALVGSCVVYKVSADGVRVLTTDPFDGQPQGTMAVKRKGEWSYTFKGEAAGKPVFSMPIYDMDHVVAITKVSLPHVSIAIV